MNKKIYLTLLLISVFSTNIALAQKTTTMQKNSNYELATFGGGCFWCTEAIFQELEGVESVVAGYAGGEMKDPTYEAVCNGNTGHAEVIQIKFDPTKIDFNLLLEVFFKTHNPTTLNRQGADRGTQYRSAVFYHNAVQREKAQQIIADLDEAQVFEDPIVTEVTPINNYYEAEDYHQNYYANNPGNGYCNAVINPKLTKFMKEFKDQLKK